MREGRQISGDDLFPSPDDVVDRRPSIWGEVFNPEQETFEPPVIQKSAEQKEMLRSRLRKYFLFKYVSDESLEEILGAMSRVEVQPGEVIIKEGDEGDFFYCIESGVFEVDKIIDGKRKVVHYYDHEGCFGELALLYNTPRAATITAARAGVVWAVDRQTFQRILLAGAFKKRVLYEGFLSKVPVLQKLTEIERANVADSLLELVFTDGQLIIKEGDEPYGMYFIISGEVLITKQFEGVGEVEVKRLETSDYFGEMGLITHGSRAASAFSVGTTRLAFLETQSFERLLGPCMQLMKRRFSNYNIEIENIRSQSSVSYTD